MRPQIWIGDVVRALRVARTEDEQAQVLRLLGFTGTVAPPVCPAAPSAGPAVPEAGSGAPDEERDAAAVNSRDTGRTVAEDQVEPPDPVGDLPLLQPVRVEPPRLPAAPVEPLPRPTSAPARLPHLPLLAPQWAGAILRDVVSRRVCEGPVDVAALIDTLAHGRPVVRLPRLPVPTLRHGVQVLVDRGSGMQPFRRDQDQLLAQLRTVVGSELVEVGYFSDVPQRGTGPGPRWTRTAYTPPAAGRRVLLLSDLGLGGPTEDHGRATRADWEAFVGLVTRAGCAVVALSPYPARRWPAWMPRLLPVISWDRTTTTGRIRARLL